MYQLRPYQERAISDLFDWLSRHPTGYPIVDASVGAGKSIIIAELCKRIIAMSPNARIVMCVASRELCQQNLDKLRAIWQDAPAGVCSASLGKKDLESQIIFATIGSIAKHADKIGKVDIMLIDECHNVNSSNAGMYRTLINDLKRFGNQSLCVIGFTGTPFRGDGVWLWQGTDPLFAGTATRISMDELLEQGYLAPLVADNSPKPKIDTSNIKVQGGDYVIKELVEIVQDDELIKAVMDDFYISGFSTRSKFLFYCVTKEHAQKVLDALWGFAGLNAHLITADTPSAERADILARYKLPKTDRNAINCLVSIGTLTTGFDAPATDCIVLLRPTRSPVLYVQIAGRGMRTADGKKDCLWLDYTDTTERLGAVNRIKGRNKSKSSMSVGEPFKYCLACGNQNPIHALECAECGEKFPEQNRVTHGTQSGNLSPLEGYNPPVERQFEVLAISYHKHQKGDKTPTLRIDYDIGEMFPVSEWVCLEHTGYALQKAIQWYSQVLPNESVPFTIDEALERLHTGPLAKAPSSIICKKDPLGKYWQIQSREFDDKQPPLMSKYTSSQSEYPTMVNPNANIIADDDDIPF